MAPRNQPIEVPHVDEIPGLPLPHQRSALTGHQATEAALLDAYRSERLHHAWILGGPKGIGKATLAFRFAAFVIANPERFSGAVKAARTMDLPDDHPVVRQVRGGGHPNILHLRRPWDDKRKRFKSDLPVDEVRRTVSFFGTTASTSAWRVCIVDAADDMNKNSANALLKVLEEPPPKCLFLVLCHAPGRLLPTIRSRCRRLDMNPLSDAELNAGLRDLLPPEDVRDDDLNEAIRFADGSLRSALTLLSGDGVGIARGFTGLAGSYARPDIPALHGFGDLIAARGKEDNWQSFQAVTRRYLHERIRVLAPGDLRQSIRYADLWERTNTAIADSDALNLDRKQVAIDLMLAIWTLARDAELRLSPNN